MSYLQKLIGEKVKAVSFEKGTFLFMAPEGVTDSEGPNRNAFEIEETHMEIGPYKLVIANPYTLMGYPEMTGAIGLTVVMAEETNEFAKLEFEAGTLTVDLRASSYRGPEAMSLYGLDMFVAVWN